MVEAKTEKKKLRALLGVNGNNKEDISKIYLKRY